MSETHKKYDGLTLAEIRALPDNQMTPAQKLALYGPGNQNRILYRVIERDGKRLLVNREFPPGAATPEGWEDSPMAFGVETQPAAEHRSMEEYDSVLGELDAPVSEPEKAKRGSRAA